MSDSNKDHDHTPPGVQEKFAVIPAHPLMADRDVDMTEAGKLFGAGHAGCRPCQDDAIESILSGDPLVVMHMTAMMCLALRDQFEQLGLVDPLAPLPHTVIGRFSPPTQLMLRKIDVDPDNTGAQAYTEGLGRDELRWVVNDVTDLLVGMAALSRTRLT